MFDDNTWSAPIATLADIQNLGIGIAPSDAEGAECQEGTEFTSEDVID